jgi:hypothetical protein
MKYRPHDFKEISVSYSGVGVVRHPRVEWQGGLIDSVIQRLRKREPSTKGLRFSDVIYLEDHTFSIIFPDRNQYLAIRSMAALLEQFGIDNYYLSRVSGVVSSDSPAILPDYIDLISVRPGIIRAHDDGNIFEQSGEVLLYNGWDKHQTLDTMDEMILCGACPKIETPSNVAQVYARRGDFDTGMIVML